MAYHSELNNPSAELVCGCPVLPLKTSSKGPAPALSDASAKDVVEETLYYFKANVLFRTFEVKTPADRLLLYLTLYTSACLRKLEECKDKASAQKALSAMASENFAIPGDGSFTLTPFFVKPNSAREAETCRSYFKQLREELGARLVEKVYSEPLATKFWMSFSKRKFLNKTL
jgi:actin related protein 2/3 complex subunit 3